MIFFQQGLLCSVQVITAAELIQEKNTVGCPCAHWLNRGTCELHKKKQTNKNPLPVKPLSVAEHHPGCQGCWLQHAAATQGTPPAGSCWWTPVAPCTVSTCCGCRSAGPG